MQRITARGDASEAGAGGEEDDDASGGGFGLSDVWIFVAAPAAAYVAAAMFVTGYNFYFGMPVGVFTVDTVVSIFEAARSYASVVLQHPTFETLLGFAFFVYLFVLPQRFYERWARAVVPVAAVALLLSFTVWPVVWALPSGIAFALLQRLPRATWLARRGADSPRYVEESRFGLPLRGPLIKGLATVMFFYATLFATGLEAARYERQFYVTDGEERYVVLAIQGTTMVTAPLFDNGCKAVTAAHLDEPLQHYYFDDDIKVFTLGDADTPAFHLYDTDGLRPKTDCGSRNSPVPQTLTSRIFI